MRWNRVKPNTINNSNVLFGKNWRPIQINKNWKKLFHDFLVSLKKEKQETKGNNNPIEVLKLRYVQGEIDKGEYEQILKNL